MRPLTGIVLFTAIEVVTLVAWLALAGLPISDHYAAILVLGVGLFFEHLVAYNVGAGRPFFSWPARS